MTFWSRYDPVNQPKGNTDHWTKLKRRAETYKDFYSGARSDLKPAAVGGDRRKVGYLKLTEKTFDDFVLDGLRGTLPGSYSARLSTSSRRRCARSSVYNERAREGFRYWLIEPPKPTSFGRYGIGSFKTVLGIGNAPRT
ncbi:hypothetical protein CHS0354_023550 [Potamilus streckersoni]|uniref:Uncharacterized protein n=1 Tax=Potamilus streckersoni TaxID=2493646 RepID=A0AAE0S8D0_9BIVA|nr:hypothetical protein CHS0354_023550 [Potamilus streckersoni]